MEANYSVPTVDVRERIPKEIIRAIANQISIQFHPKKIILFGSYAYGEPRPESDVDLLVIMNTELSEVEQALEIRRELNLMFGLDLLIYTPERYEQRLKWGDSFLKEVQEQGQVLYESNND